MGYLANRDENIWVSSPCNGGGEVTVFMESCQGNVWSSCVPYIDAAVPQQCRAGDTNR